MRQPFSGAAAQACPSTSEASMPPEELSAARRERARRWVNAPDLRDCLKRVAVRSDDTVDLGYEDTNLPHRSAGPPLGLYQRSGACRQRRWSTTQPGYATDHQRDPLHSGYWRPMAYAAKGLSQVAKRLLLLSHLAR